MNSKNLPPIAEALEQTGHPELAKRLRDRALLECGTWERGVHVWRALAKVKAEVAQRLASLLLETDGNEWRWDFETPDYIRSAMEHALGQTSEGSESDGSSFG